MNIALPTLKNVLIFSLLTSTGLSESAFASAFSDLEPQTQRPFHSQEVLDAQYHSLRRFMPEESRVIADNFYSSMQSLSLGIRNTRLSTTMTFQEKLSSFSASAKQVTQISTDFINSTNPFLSPEIKRAINGCAGYFSTQENAHFLEYLWSELEPFLKEFSSLKNTPLPPLERESFRKAHDLLSRYEAINTFHKSIYVEPTYSFLEVAQEMSEANKALPLRLCEVISTQFAKAAEDLLYKFSYSTNLEAYALRLRTLDEAQRLDFYDHYKQLCAHAQAIDPYEGNTLNNLTELLEFCMVYTKLSPEERAHFQLGTPSPQHATLPRGRAGPSKSHARTSKRPTSIQTIASIRSEIATHLLEKARNSLTLATDRYASLLEPDAFAPMNALYERCMDAYAIIQPTRSVSASSSRAHTQEPITQPLVTLQNLLSDIQDAHRTLREMFNEKSQRLAQTRLQESSSQDVSLAAMSTPVQINMRSSVIEEHIKAGKLTSADKHKPKKGPKKNTSKNKGKRRS